MASRLESDFREAAKPQDRLAAWGFDGARFERRSAEAAVAAHGDMSATAEVIDEILSVIEKAALAQQTSSDPAFELLRSIDHARAEIAAGFERARTAIREKGRGDPLD